MLIPDHRRGIQLFVHSHQPPAAPIPGWQWGKAGVSSSFAQRQWLPSLVQPNATAELYILLLLLDKPTLQRNSNYKSQRLGYSSTRWGSRDGGQQERTATALHTAGHNSKLVLGHLCAVTCSGCLNFTLTLAWCALCLGFFFSFFFFLYHVAA